MADAPADLPPLWSRYLDSGRRVHLTGLQALVRLPLDQVRRDRAAGRRTGALISGYPGSPLAGYDQELGRVKRLLDADGVSFAPGLNEELALGHVAGTQMLDRFPHPDWDGVVGIWYGKAPGLDRAMDALRHANFCGTSRYGGALAVCGDDPFCKSSSLPSHSEHAFAHALVPLLAPADAREVLELGLHGLALSRWSGLWVGLRIVADVADGGSIFEVPERWPEPELPKFEIAGRSFAKRFDPRLLPPHVNRIEEEIFFRRLEAARRYAYENELDRIVASGDRDRIGLVASGTLARELDGALHYLGLDAPALGLAGIRVYHVRMPFPIEPRRLAEFADGLDEIVVVDTRRGFLEEQIRSALFNTIDHPQVLGRLRETGEPWLSRDTHVSAESLAIDLGEHLAQRLDRPDLRAQAARLGALAERDRDAIEIGRPPHFCSGCPHLTSTRVPEGSLAGGGIGCHTMALLMDREVQFIGAMGSEGSLWSGLERFVSADHLFQNLGDGTYFHSGRLAVRSAVESGANLTFKLLYNGTIAMTGGQAAVGQKSVSDVVRDLLSDGVRKIVAVTDDRELRRLALWHPRVRRVSRHGYDRAMKRLTRERGVTAIVYDQLCANQKQRLERRGVLSRPTARIEINRDVCEGCGDCGRKSGCASLRPVSTSLGRKTRIHRSSCSDDRSCLVGDCPAFVSVESPALPPTGADRWLADAIPEPTLPELDTAGGRFELYLTGIGSTGVVTVDAILMRAAEIEGLYALHLDQTGLSQRGGKVVSHAVLSRRPIGGAPHVGWGRADTLLGFDPIGAADAEGLAAVDPDRTFAMLHSCVAPTSEMVEDPRRSVPEGDELADRLRPFVRELAIVPAEALAEAVFGEALCANVILLGAALQAGAIPLSPESLERAIRDRAVAVESNLAALRLGRAVRANPALVDEILRDTRPPAIGDDGDPARAAEIFGTAWDRVDGALDRFEATPEREGLRRRLAALSTDLVDYQSPRYATRFLSSVLALAVGEAKVNAQDPAVTSAAMTQLYRLMAYKDEYEVARLHLRGPHRRWLEAHTEGPLVLRYHLHPPLLRALGLDRKLDLGPLAEPLFRSLLKLRALRGTPLDPFGYTRVRRRERALGRWYRRVLATVALSMCEENRKLALRIVGAPAALRGYEDVKLAGEADLRASVAEQLRELERSGHPE